MTSDSRFCYALDESPRRPGVSIRCGSYTRHRHSHFVLSVRFERTSCDLEIRCLIHQDESVESRIGFEPTHIPFAAEARSQFGYLDTERVVGSAPTIFALATRCSTTELHPQNTFH